jgi:hypothetical protein
MGKVTRRDRQRIDEVLSLLKGIEGAMSARVMLPDMKKLVTVWRDAKVTLTDTDPSIDPLEALPPAERRLVERFRSATPSQRRQALRGLYALELRAAVEGENCFMPATRAEQEALGTVQLL